jgi:hypothetical protein
MTMFAIFTSSSVFRSAAVFARGWFAAWQISRVRQFKSADRPHPFSIPTRRFKKSIFRDLWLISIAKCRGKRVLLHIHGGRYLDEPAAGASRWPAL